MANFNINKVILGGRMTADAELKQTQQGVSVTTFSIAVNRRAQKDKETQTDFINCVAWRQTAEFISRYFKKGSSICVSGNIQVRSYEDKQGVKRSTTEVICEEAFFVDSKSEGASPSEEPTFQQPSQANFEDVTDDEDLPF